jgi:ABC-type phosphate transport system substrate-binding protein
LSLDTGKAQPPFGRSRAGTRVLAVTAAAAAAVVLTACGSSPGGPPPDVSLAGAASSSSVHTLSETGSSLMAPLFALWAPAYHARFSQVTLRTVSSSSGEGISSAAAGRADIGASDAFLSPATLVVNTSQPSATRARDLRAFLTWAVTSGTAQLAKVNFQPLPPSIVALSDAQIATIRS